VAAIAKRIIVGFDGSDEARRALDRAAELAGYGSTVTVVNVVSAARAGRPLADARDHLAERHVRAEIVERAGEPAEALIDTATAEDADLLVVGRRNGGKPFALDSVVDRIVQDAPCDVLVVR
jgi:nucleotide-binding universal stress UspA family protein